MLCVQNAHEVWGNTCPDLISQMATQSRSRGWCFTINNPTFGDKLDIDALQATAKYYIYGHEHGTENQTYHLQGYVYFQHPTTFRRVRTILRRAHIEQQRGSIKDAIEYCKKEGSFEEWGDKPEVSKANTQRERWRQLIQLAEEGDFERIKDDFPSEFIRYGKRLLELRKRRLEPIDGELQHEWWYGATGTGKSRALWSMFPGHYAKELNKWWDGYQDEEVVAIEEWAPKNECTASYLKIWADRYPFPAQIKGGTIRGIRPKKIIILSNYTIDQCFQNEEDRNPIKRRFKVVHFPAMFTPVFPLASPTEEDIEALLSLSQ